LQGQLIRENVYYDSPYLKNNLQYQQPQLQPVVYSMPQNTYFRTNNQNLADNNYQYMQQQQNSFNDPQYSQDYGVNFLQKKEKKSQINKSYKSNLYKSMMNYYYDYPNK
jgi:hypothetical protein